MLKKTYQLKKLKPKKKIKKERFPALRGSPQRGVHEMAPIITPMSLAHSYAGKLLDLSKKMISEVESAVLHLHQRMLVDLKRVSVQDSLTFDEEEPGDKSDEFEKIKAQFEFENLNAFEAIEKKYNDLFSEISEPLAKKFTLSLSDASKKGAAHSINSASSVQAKMENPLELKSSFADMGLEKDLSTIINNNIDLIKTVPKEYFSDLKKQTQESFSKDYGEGTQGIYDFLKYNAKGIKKYGGTVERRILFIAQNETRKNYSALAAVRVQKAGVKKFIWHSTGAGLVPRESHKELSGQTFEYDNPPVIDEHSGERGIPGQTYNCHCYAEPVVEVAL